MSNIPNLPNQKPYKDLTPFDLVLIQKFPFIEEDFDGINLYGILSKIKECLNKTIYNQEIVEQNQSDLYNYVNTYFINLDVQEEINNKLDAMAQNGTLETIISQVLKKQTGSLICSIAYRDCQEFIDGVTDESGNGITGYMQGMTTTENTIIYALQNGGNKQNQTNKILLREVNKNTGATIRENWFDLGHANAIAYNDTAKEIYIVPLFYRDNGDVTFTKNVVIIDYTTFTIKNTVTPAIDGDRVNGISYDNKNNVLALSTINKVFIMEDFQTISRTININNSTNVLYNSSDVQYLAVYDNLIYQIKFFENGISVYDFDGNLINNYFDFDVEVPFRIGELESISIEEDGTIYIASVQEVIASNSVAKLYDNTILKSNLIKNGIKRFYESGVTTAGIQYYVDSTTTNKIQAGTQLYPFKHVEQALFTIEYQARNTLSTINLVGTNKDYGFILAKSNQKIQVRGNGNKVHLIELQEQAIQFTNLTIDCTDLVNVSDSTNQSNIYIHNDCTATFRNCNFINNAENKKDNCIVSNFSFMKFFECTFSNFTNVFRMLNFSKIKGSSLTYTDCTYKYYNEANCVIDMNENTIYYDMNPNSQTSVITPNVLQSVGFTLENNKITFNNKNLDRFLYPFSIFKAYVDVVVESGTSHRMEIELNTDYQARQHLKTISANTQYTYDIFVLVTHTREQSNGEWTLQLKCIKTNLSTNERTDISSGLTYSIIKIVKI